MHNLTEISWYHSDKNLVCNISSQHRYSSLKMKIQYNFITWQWNVWIFWNFAIMPKLYVRNASKMLDLWYIYHYADHMSIFMYLSLCRWYDCFHYADGMTCFQFVKDILWQIQVNIPCDVLLVDTALFIAPVSHIQAMCVACFLVSWQVGWTDRVNKSSWRLYLSPILYLHHNNYTSF